MRSARGGRGVPFTRGALVQPWRPRKRWSFYAGPARRYKCGPTPVAFGHVVCSGLRVTRGGAGEDVRCRIPGAQHPFGHAERRPAEASPSGARRNFSLDCSVPSSLLLEFEGHALFDHLTKGGQQASCTSVPQQNGSNDRLLLTRAGGRCFPVRSRPTAYKVWAPTLRSLHPSGPHSSGPHPPPTRWPEAALAYTGQA